MKLQTVNVGFLRLLDNIERDEPIRLKLVTDNYYYRSIHRVHYVESRIFSVKKYPLIHLILV